MRPRRLLHTLTAAALTIAAALLGPGTAQAQPAPLGTVPLEGGVALHGSNGARCTAGFNVRTPGTGYVLLQSCSVQTGDTMYGPGNVPVGTVTGPALLRVENTAHWEQVGRVHTYPGSQSITGATEAPVGAQVCMSGAVSGLRCGRIEAKNQVIYYPGGPVYGVTRTNICAQPGDGGAPVFSGTQAQGLVLGGSGCTTYFVPIREYLSAYGLDLFTE
ncbi:MAG TPA: S1 family peptidase [Pseudonocardiaceae bacterium]